MWKRWFGTMAAELKHRLGVTYRKICDFLKTYCGLHAAPAIFVRAEQHRLLSYFIQVGGR